MRSLLLFTLLLVVKPSIAQNVINLGEVEDTSKIIKELGKNYADAGHADTSKALFTVEELGPAWRQILTDLNRQLLDDGLEWEGPLRIWQRFYFSENGTIEYYVYRFLGNTLNEEEQHLFHNAVQNFVQVAQFNLKAGQKFAQCGTASYMSSKK